MKLKNKKTGEIVDLFEIVRLDDVSNEFYLRLSDNEGRTFKVGFNSLDELNAEWEDYHEEPKERWHIDYNGTVKCFQYLDYVWHKEMQSIGNYFETKEEAEKAVEKLKAWKRLKDDYHIRFDLDFVKNTISFTYRIDGTLHSVMNDEPIVFEDMKTIFGGEE